MLAMKVFPITYNTENVQFGGFLQKKNAAIQKRLQRFLNPIQF